MGMGARARFRSHIDIWNWICGRLTAPAVRSREESGAVIVTFVTRKFCVAEGNGYILLLVKLMGTNA